MSNVLKEVIALRDNYENRLKESEYKLEEARDKGQHNHYSQMLVEVADYKKFINHLNWIIKRAGQENA